MVFTSQTEPSSSGWCPTGEVKQRRALLESNSPRNSQLETHRDERTGQRDANWPDWYAEYMAAEQAGTELPT
jgi:hypothetical protein